MQTQPLISDARIPRVVEDYLSLEQKAGRLFPPVPTHLVQSCHISPLGLVSKSQPGKWRLITDLSSPRYHSINDGITSDLCSIQYCKVDDAIQLLLTYEANALMCKVDLKSAYRVIPIHPDDRPLLSIRCISQHGFWVTVGTQSLFCFR